MTQWTWVHLAKARARKAEARMERAKAKDSTDNTDRTGTRARTRIRTRLNVGTVGNVSTSRKIVGSRRTPKVVRRENTNTRMQMLTILTRNHLRRCKNLNGSRLELTQVQERQHGLRVPLMERRFLVTVISLSAQQLVKLSKVASECKLWVATIGDPISGFEVFKHRCANHCCLLENTRQRVESLCCMVTKVTCSTKVRMLQRKLMLGSRRS